MPVKWFMGVLCRKCAFPILLFEDPSDGKRKFTGGGKLRAPCHRPECNHQDDYSTDEVYNLSADVPELPAE